MVWFWFFFFSSFKLQEALTRANRAEIEKHSADSSEKHLLATTDDQKEPVVGLECDLLEISVQFTNQRRQDLVIKINST